jgi:hypothetical protein
MPTTTDTMTGIQIVREIKAMAAASDRREVLAALSAIADSVADNAERLGGASVASAVEKLRAAMWELDFAANNS